MKSPIHYVKESLIIYTKKENFIFFAKIMSVLLISSVSISYLTDYLFPVDDWKNIGFVLLTAIYLLVGLWAKSAEYFSVLNIGKPESEIFKLGYKNIISLFVISSVYILIVIIGLVLLIIPGVVFGTWYSFSTFLVLDKKLNLREALKTSKLMVGDDFWKILGIYIFFGIYAFLISLVLSMIPDVGILISYFIAPAFILPFYLLYKDLLLSRI